MFLILKTWNSGDRRLAAHAAGIAVADAAFAFALGYLLWITLTAGPLTPTVGLCFAALIASYLYNRAALFIEILRTPAGQCAGDIDDPGNAQLSQSKD